MASPINHPAFPVTAYNGDDTNPPVRPNSGMGIRDYFAAAALTGLIAWEERADASLATDAYKLADAMLRQRTEKK
jgi:hypothetical protein